MGVTSSKSKAAVSLIISIFIVAAWSIAALAGPPAKKPPPSSRRLYSSVWRKASPPPKKSTQSSHTSSAVAGLRGDEKGKFLRPYWKGEKKKKEGPDAAAFREADKLMHKENFGEAEQAFLNIMAKFPKSPLIPMVKIGLAISYAQQGKKDEARHVLDEWLKEYPKHELAPDVKAVLAELKK